MGDVNFDCSEKGLQVQSMDSSHVALVSLLLRESAFADFKCDRATSLGMNIDSLCKIFKICGNNDSLKLKWENDANSPLGYCDVVGYTSTSSVSPAFTNVAPQAS